MRISFFLAAVFFFNSFTWSQMNLEEFNEVRVEHAKNHMWALGAWSGVNMIGGGIGWATAPNQEMRSFHQMNLFWNTVNLGISVAGLVKARKESTKLSFAETIRQQERVEDIFLINAGLDVVYIAGGLVLRSESKTNLEYQDQFKGFGNSLLIQGGFLLVLDWVAYGIHRSHNKNELSPLLDRIELSDNGFGLKLKLDKPFKTVGTGTRI